MKYLLTVILAILLNSQVAIASERVDKQKRAHSKVVTHKSINKRTAANKVKKQYPGKVLKVNEHDGFYRVRMLRPKGKVVDFKVNKKNGSVKKDN